MDAGRSKKVNQERQALAASYGWEFAGDAPELLKRWAVKPFTEIGDQRQAYGKITGNLHNLPFTVFDYHRRPAIVTTHKVLTSEKHDTIVQETVWVITLPGSLPRIEVFDPYESEVSRDGEADPRTATRKFNGNARLVNTDPAVAAALLTPQVSEVAANYKLYKWAVVGNDLVVAQRTIARLKPEKLLGRLAEIAQLVAAFPPHLWQQGGGTPEPAPTPEPQQYQQPQYQQPQYAQQPYPPQPPYPAQPQYPQQPYPPQPYPQQPAYPQPPYPQPPPPGYPPPGYPPPNPYGH